MFELEEIVSYKVFGREFSNKEDALKYSKILQNRQNLLNKLDLKILKIRDWSMEISVNGNRVRIAFSYCFGNGFDVYDSSDDKNTITC